MKKRVIVYLLTIFVISAFLFGFGYSSKDDSLFEQNLSSLSQNEAYHRGKCYYEDISATGDQFYEYICCDPDLLCTCEVQTFTTHDREDSCLLSKVE